MEQLNVASKKQAPKERGLTTVTVYATIHAVHKNLIEKLTKLEGRKNNADFIASMISQFLPFKERMAIPILLEKDFESGDSRIQISETLHNLDMLLTSKKGESVKFTFDSSNKSELISLISVLHLFSNRI